MICHSKHDDNYQRLKDNKYAGYVGLDAYSLRLKLCYQKRGS